MSILDAHEETSFFISFHKAEGYAEGDLTLYHRASVTDFLRAANPVDFLSKASEVSPLTQEYREREPQKHSLGLSFSFSQTDLTG